MKTPVEPIAVTYPAAMAMLQVSEATLHRLIKAGVLVRKVIRMPGTKRPISRITTESITRCLQDKPEPFQPDTRPIRAKPSKVLRPVLLTRSMKPVLEIV